MKKLLIALIIFLSLPAVALAQEPLFTIDLATDQTAPGSLFIGSFAFGSPVISPTLLILENSGKRIYSQPLSDWGLDFKQLPNGLISYYHREDRAFKLMNSRFEEVGEVRAVGYEADHHDLQLSPDGQRYLLMIYRNFQYDMSQIIPGGSATATVTSCLIQEIDQNNNLVWSWDSWDYTPITYTNQNLTSPTIDYDHCNSLHYDTDGNILVSSRALDSVTKINRTTGTVMWRLGGVANEFTFTNDNGFALQHDTRRIANGRLTLFDNGQTDRGYSRAVEYEIDEIGKIITRTWEYRGPFASCCGNAQRLPNGNTLINWGPGKPSLTEVTPGGTKVFELTLIGPRFSYRAFRFPITQALYFPLMFKKYSGS